MKIGVTERGDAALYYDEIDFSAVDGCILITKHPQLLFEKVSIRHPPIPYIVHCTITGFGGTMIEPNVPDFDDSYEGYKKFNEILAPERLVLRIDPIWPTFGGIVKAISVLDSIKPIHRFRISFLDAYPHVRVRLGASGFKLPWEGIHQELDVRKKLLEKIKVHSPVEVEVCGEPGLPCAGCVSGRDLLALRLTPALKLGAQRLGCKCLAVKKELLNHRRQCKFSCLYCYWTH